MTDRPTAAELIDAVRLYLEKELLPALTDQRQRFQTLVAANVLTVAGRELAGEEEALRCEWADLAALLGEAGAAPAGLVVLRAAVGELNGRLAGLIREGQFDETQRLKELLGVLRRQVVAKLAVANPRYLEAPRPRG